MKNLTSFYSFLLSYIFSLNIFTFLPTTITKNTYLTFFLVFCIILIYSFSSLKITRSTSSVILFIFFFLQLLRIDVPFFVPHINYLVIFIIQILFLNSIKSSYFNIPKIQKYLTITGYSTIILSLLHLIFGMFKPGWNWPVNIALQEITIIGIIYSIWILNGSLKKTIPLVLLFSILLVLRDSGKASLLAIILGIISAYSFKNRQLRIFNSIYIFQISFVFVAWGLYKILNTESEGSLIRYYLIKRFGLIMDGISYLTEKPANFILGSGFDTLNYFEVGTFEYAYENAPQLFILSTSVFGGVLLPILLIKNIKNYFLEIRKNANTTLKAQLFGFLISIGVINSFHEYFNNPFVFFSLSLVIISFNSKLNSENDPFYNHTCV